MQLLFAILFPVFGCLIITFGVLRAVFNERWARIANNSPFAWRPVTPEYTRVTGVIVGFFGLIFLVFSLVIDFAP